MTNTNYIDIISIDSKERGDRVKEIKLLQVSDKVIEAYRREVKGNERLPTDQVIKKIHRNIQLVKEADKKYIKRNLFSTTYMYGNLHLKVKFNKVIELVNHKGRHTDWHVNWKRYEQLSRQLGILDYKKNHYNKNKRKLS